MLSISCSYILIILGKIEMHGIMIIVKFTDAQRSACLDKGALGLFIGNDLDSASTATRDSNATDTHE